MYGNPSAIRRYFYEGRWLNRFDPCSKHGKQKVARYRREHIRYGAQSRPLNAARQALGST